MLADARAVAWAAVAAGRQCVAMSERRRARAIVDDENETSKSNTKQPSEFSSAFDLLHV